MESSPSLRTSGGLLLLVCLLAGSGCNEYPVAHLQDRVLIQRDDIYFQGSRTEIDVLWVVDNSSSMCEEQATLSSQFTRFIEGLSGLEASFQVAVVSTTMDPRYPDEAGAIRYAPAHTHSGDCVSYVACTDDLQCGTGGCLCGVPWLQRCDTAEDCPASAACLSHQLPSGEESALRYCSATCEQDTDCQDVRRETRTLHCLDGRCRLQTCETDEDCVEGQRCLPSHEDEDAISFCRRFRTPPRISCNRIGEIGPPCPAGTRCLEGGQCEPVGSCPPQTCDCALEAEPILSFEPEDLRAGEDAQKELRDRFRCLALLGTDGDTYEKGLEAAERAVTPPRSLEGVNGRFSREDAYLVIIFLSDENDCSDRGASCESKEDCPDPENYACDRDPVQRDQFYCRLPQRETQECEYWSSRLMDVELLAARIKDAKALPEDRTETPCTDQSDCAFDPGLYCSHDAGVCTADAQRVIVAGIVGDRDLFCASQCPEADGRECEASEACTEACPEGTFCAERTYKPGPTETGITCIDPVFGTAYSGRRYHEFVSEFDDQGVIESICGGQLDRALERIASLVADVVPDSFCLTWPLPRCESDEDCRPGSRCELREERLGAATPYCVAEGTGAGGQVFDYPYDLIIELHPEDGSEPRTVPPENWIYTPGARGGCVEFRTGGPGPEERLYLRYLTTLDPDVPLVR